MATSIPIGYSPSDAIATLRERHFSIIAICGWTDARAVALRSALATCDPVDVVRALDGGPEVRA